MSNPYPPPQRPNAGLSFFGFTGGIAILLLVAMILLPIVMVVLCCGAGVFGIAFSPDPTPSSTP
jgi:hypothetical protein